jgi:hypothetical protein
MQSREIEILPLIRHGWREGDVGREESAAAAMRRSSPKQMPEADAAQAWPTLARDR